MQVFRGLHHPGIAPASALTIGNFDGVHRGHQAMLALLINEARHRGVPSCVLSFEPQPRDHFARLAGQPELAPRRVATLRDKLSELERCGIDQAVIMRFDAAFAAQSPQAFIDDVLVRGLHVRYVLVGDDFCFGARRAGDYTMLDAAGARQGFDVARMLSYEVHGLRVSSSAVREALATGDMVRAASLLGRPYSISGRVVGGYKLGKKIGFPTANIQLKHNKPPVRGIFVVQVRGLGDRPLPGVASLGTRPTLHADGKPTLEVHLFDFIRDIYGTHLRVDFLAKLREEEKYPDLGTLTRQIGRDVENAKSYFLTAEAQRR